MKTIEVTDAFDRWINLMGPLRAALLEPLRNRLSEPVPAPSGAADIVAPVIELVERAPLWMYQGRIDERIAIDMAKRYGWKDYLHPGAEEALKEVDILTMHLVVAELFKKRSRVRPEHAIKEAASDPDRLWELIADTFLTRYYIWGSQPELTLAHLVRKRHEGENFECFWHAAVEAFYVEDRISDPEKLFDQLEFSSTMTGQILRALRMIDLTEAEDGPVMLTDAGYVTALRALRAAMLSDDRAVWAYQERGLITPN
ncbi:MAG: hypothetical protein ACRDLB_16560 [Actinomycetota bacterium]